MLFAPGKKIIVFGGPSLSLIKIKEHNHFEYKPPIKRGDLLNIIDTHRGKPIVLITDGIFGDSLSITPNECIEYINNGGLLFGCSSIGALRAADCYSRGMVGVGDIFMGYHLGYYHSESDVAVLYDKISFQEITYSFAHIDYLLKILVRKNLITTIDVRKIVKLIRNIMWYERTQINILQIILSATTCEKTTNLFKELMISDIHNPKKNDALLACSYLLQYYKKQCVI